jgi:hypothetical protein
MGTPSVLAGSHRRGAMSGEERAVRDAVISKIAEMRKEVTKLVAAMNAVEIRVRSQPLSEKLQMGTPLRAIEGWIQSLMESQAVIALCEEDTGSPNRYQSFANQLSMTIANWRDVYATSYSIDDLGPRGRRGPKKRVVAEPGLPAKTISGHQDVRRVLAKRSGKPDGPPHEVVRRP